MLLPCCGHTLVLWFALNHVFLDQRRSNEPFVAPALAARDGRAPAEAELGGGDPPSSSSEEVVRPCFACPRAEMKEYHSPHTVLNAGGRPGEGFRVATTPPSGGIQLHRL